MQRCTEQAFMAGNAFISGVCLVYCSASRCLSPSLLTRAKTTFPRSPCPHQPSFHSRRAAGCVVRSAAAAGRCPMRCGGSMPSAAAPARSLGASCCSTNCTADLDTLVGLAADLGSEACHAACHAACRAAGGKVPAALRASGDRRPSSSSTRSCVVALQGSNGTTGEL